MNKNYFILLFVLFFSFGLIGYSQISTNWKINNTTTNYFVGEKEFTIYTYEIVNNSNDEIWLWFMENDSSNVNGKDAIWNYFFSRHGGDFSMLDIELDGNVIFQSSIFYTFVKRISPSEKFYIHFISNHSDKDINQKKLLQRSVSDKMKIYAQKELIERDMKFKLFVEGRGFIFYKSSFIIIPVENFISFPTFSK